MQPTPPETSASATAVWAGAIASALLGAWIVFDANPGINWGLWVASASLSVVIARRFSRLPVEKPTLILLGWATLLAFAPSITASVSIRALVFLSAGMLLGLAVIVIGGILLLTAIDMIRLEVVRTIMASQEGAAGIFHLLVSWTFGILKAAIIVMVISSWLPISPYSKWVSWSYRLSTPILAPLRRVVPNLGGLDITPILAYILLNIIEAFLYRLM